MTKKKAYKDEKDTTQQSDCSTEAIIYPEVVKEPEPLVEQRISVRNLVEFLLRRGNIDNRRQGAPEHAMQEGSRIHRMLQRRMGTEYQAEVSLKYTKIMEHYILVVEGRADGIMDTQNPNTGEREVLIDEIKGTYRDLIKMKEPAPVHLAQAKCYAYFYGLKQDLDKLQVRMTYCNMETEEVRYFYFDYLFTELEEWFQELIREYQKWSDYEWKWKQLRKKTIEELTFPFEYRKGQKELIAYVYHTICQKKKLFVEAPTGVGKTISTVYPAVQAVGAGMAERIFYLTAKTITRTVADNTFQLLRQQGLSFKTVILTAKDKICFMDKPECNPLACPYAKGHYDRINNANYELLTQEENFTREKLEHYARKHMVCPFEMCLDISLFSDGVICDYNYLFDPHVYLKRFFGEGSHGSYIFLIDEAHNLLERGREMFSATLIKEQFLDLKRALSRTTDRKIPTRNSTKRSEPFQQLELLSIMQAPIMHPSLENKITEQEENQSNGSTVQELLVIENQEQVKEQLGGIVQEKEKQESTEQEKRIEQEKEKQESTEQEKGQRERTEQEKEQLEKLVQKKVEYRESSQEESESFDLQVEVEEYKLLEKRSILYRQGYASKMEKQLEKCNKEMLALKRKCETCQVVQDIDSLVQAVIRLQGTIDQYLDEQEEVSLPVREDILECYFELCHFLDIYERLDEHYVKYTQLEEDGRFILKLFCVNPAENLKECLARGRSSILFSATFLPIQYYKRLLGGEKEDYEVYAQSVFDPEKRELLIASDVTSKFTRRSEEEYFNIARYIDEIVKNRHGNYMVFCPSYVFLKDIYERYVENFANEQRECILQQGFMDEKDREAFLERFAQRDYVDPMQEDMGKEEDYSLIGFCVLGGIFSEGIDLKKDRLIGVIIVGTGIPQVCWERELLKDYFNEEGENGFDYSYRYPGMNKVLQAAGRVIRTMEDIGVIALLDERFLQYTYQRLFPREWSSFQVVTVHTVAKRVERFWDSWL